MLSQQELERYGRQIMMPGWSKDGQEKLKESKVQVAGAGGLGSAVLTCLAAAGVGEIRIIDNDRVELSNLNRQTLHTEKDIGKTKVRSAEEGLQDLNPHIRIETVGQEITEETVIDLLDDCPIIDAMDNLPARFLLNKAALKKNLPLFHGAVYGLEGRATTIIPYDTACLKCLYQSVVPGEIPVAGVTPGVIGCIQATEVLKYLMGFGDLLCNRLLIFDGFSMKFSEVKLKKDPNCQGCGSLSTY